MRRERSQVNLRNELKHAPTEHLIVVVLELVFDKLFGVHIHQNRVDIFAQTRQLCLLKLVRISNWEVNRCTQHLMHVLGTPVHIHIGCTHQWLIVQ